MNKNLELVCQSLDALSLAVSGGSAEERLFTEAYGWNCPAVTKNDLALIPKRLASRIREASPEDLDEELVIYVNDLPRRLQVLQTNTLPYLFNGHAVNAVPAYLATLELLRQQFEPLLSWQIVNDPKAMPSKLAKRVRSLSADLDEITPNLEILSQQIKQIQDAHEAAESLPVDLQALKDVHIKVTKISDDAVVILGKITPRENEVNDVLVNVRASEVEASKLVEKCEEAYKITTTKGLAGAFELRAKDLSHSMYVWVIGLISALVSGAVIGKHSFDLLLTAFAGETKWELILLNIILAILSVGAPVWFSWVATKQIGQRFRLAEDYAFKASVAKAYEGYKEEAARIDPAFEARLFSSALTRLEEAPLRLVESESHGSPWHELFASKGFQKAINTIPELKDKFIEVAKAGSEKFDVKKALPDDVNQPLVR